MLQNLPEQHFDLRGHKLYSEEVLAAPELYATEDIPRDEKIVLAHFFIGRSHWWLLELNPETGVAFGYVCLNEDVQNSELGYFSLLELEGIVINNAYVVQRDLDWQPTPLGRVLEALRD